VCEINPTQTKILRLEFFTSHPTISKEEFEHKVAAVALEMEMLANKSGELRCHIHDER
jgi:hypothetical protein